MQILAEAEDLPSTANIRTQLIGLWTAPVFGAVLLIAFVAFPGFLPPMSPEMTAEQVAAFYADNTAMIRFSMITYNLCGIMLLPFFMVIVVQMKRMTTQSHALAYCYLTAAVSGATLFALADIFYLVAAFRPDRSPELLLLLNDLAWITLVAPVGMLVAQNLLLGLAIGIVGIDSLTGQPRATFGIPLLSDGIDIVVIAVAVFAVGEALWVAAHLRRRPADVIPVGRPWMSKQDWGRSWKPWLRGTAFGFPFGALPAGGAEPP